MEVVLRKPEDLVWPMGRMESTPEYMVGCGSYPRAQKVDPYPCYAPDFCLSHELIRECEEKFPLTDSTCGFYLLSHEVIDRFNGTTFTDTIYDDARKTTVKCGCGCGKDIDLYPQALFVVLSGKRIPLQPSMLRYLVAHEYGHMVFHYITRKRGFRDSDDKSVLESYMEVRGVSKEHYTTVYSGAKWHSNPGEIFANDFRTLIMGREQEFWPHNKFFAPPPQLCTTKLFDWWEESCNLCGVKFNPVSSVPGNYWSI